MNKTDSFDNNNCMEVAVLLIINNKMYENDMITKDEKDRIEVEILRKLSCPNSTLYFTGICGALVDITCQLSIHIAL